MTDGVASNTEFVGFSAGGDFLSSGSSEKRLQVEECDWCDVGGVGGTFELSGLVMTDFKAGFLKVGEAALADVCLESLDLLSGLRGDLRGDLEYLEERDGGWLASRRGDGLDWCSGLL